MNNGKPIDWETRLSRLEADVQEIKALLQAQQPKWWKGVVGSFADNDAFEEATRLGREIREKEREKAREKARRSRPKKKVKS